MIRSLSPYYISIPWVSPESGKKSLQNNLSVYIWSEDKTPVPVDPEYEFTKYNSGELSGTDNTIDIARIIADFIEITPKHSATTANVDADSTYWVKWEYTYIVVGDIVEDTPQGETTKLFSRGYSYGNEGGNIETVTNNLLFQVDEFNVNRGGVYCLPLLANESGNVGYSIASFPASELVQVGTVIATTNASESGQLVFIDLSDAITDTYAIVKVNNIEVATLVIKDELKYTPVNLYFINKLGFQQSFTLFKERKDRINVTENVYQSRNGQPISGNHQFKRFNVQGKTSFSVWSGFIDETNNETIQQLLLSESIWIVEGVNLIPINIKTASNEWKTQVNERLINYNLEFEYSYTLINSI